MDRHTQFRPTWQHVDPEVVGRRHDGGRAMSAGRRRRAAAAPAASQD